MEHQDWEHEAQKDFIYLQEELLILQEMLQEELNRIPAQIIIIDKDKIHTDEQHHISTISPNT
jgi:hypothetical protein